MGDLAAVGQQFGFRKERIDWFDTANMNGTPCATNYRIVPEGWMKGGIDLHRDVRAGDSGGQFDAARSKGNYLPFGPNSGWRKYQGSSQTYTSDVSAFGVTLKAVSGWGNNVDINWTFGPGSFEHDLYNINAHPRDAKIIYSY